MSCLANPLMAFDGDAAPRLRAPKTVSRKPDSRGGKVTASEFSCWAVAAADEEEIYVVNADQRGKRRVNCPGPAALLILQAW
jgi:hypothetical protein